MIGFPGFAIGRIGEHEIEAHPGEFIRGQGRSVLDVLGIVALDHHVGLADGIGFIVDFLAIQKYRIGFYPERACRVFQIVLRFGEHAAGATGRVVDQHGGRQLALYPVEKQMGHQMNDLTRGEMLTGLFVVFFVELADEFFEDIAHAQVGQRREFASVRVCRGNGRQVDVG